MRKMCIYCGKWYDLSTMTPMYEEGKEGYNAYCENCVDEVKSNVRSLPWYHLYYWGKKGSIQ